MVVFGSYLHYISYENVFENIALFNVIYLNHILSLNLLNYFLGSFCYSIFLGHFFLEFFDRFDRLALRCRIWHPDNAAAGNNRRGKGTCFRVAIVVENNVENFLYFQLT